MASLIENGKKILVQAGDTLSEIAQKYTPGISYQSLAAMNGIVDPDLIYVGQEISIDGSATTTTASSAGKATITAFGIQSNSNNVLFATWKWDQPHTASYKIKWQYATGDGVWFVGNESSNTVDPDSPNLSKQSLYSIPSNATRVQFEVKPISETYESNGQQVSYWTASWSTAKVHDVEHPPAVPSTPSVTIDGLKLTATINDIVAEDLYATHIQFQVVKGDTTSYKTASVQIDTTFNIVTYTCTVAAGGVYKVRCRSQKGSKYGDWSSFSASVGTAPLTPSGITTIKAKSETSVYLEWPEVDTAETYDLEYATKKDYFDGSDQTSTVNGVEFTHYEKTGLESGMEYFFRVRAVNEYGESGWSSIKSVVVGTEPNAPTTWSSTTTVITGEPLVLYWVHNTEDGSAQKYAQLELIIGGEKITTNIQNEAEDEDEEELTSSYSIDTSEYVEGTEIRWKVRTCGVTLTFGEWSVERTIKVYAQPTLEFRITNIFGDVVEQMESFPLKVYGLPGPDTQAPIGYHVSIVANEAYEAVDTIGNAKMVKAGEEVYSRYFDVIPTDQATRELDIQITASDVDLANNISYTIKGTVSMNSGLTAESTADFTVSWEDDYHTPNAEVGVDNDILVAHIRPYCRDNILKYYRVTYNSGLHTYSLTDEELPAVCGTVVENARTLTGELVYDGWTSENVQVYYAEVIETILTEDVLLSVYRREFDGSFTELAIGLENNGTTFITDPHPSLDFARYRIVATSIVTGAITYYDMPGVPIGEKAIIIQWDEGWSNFDPVSEDMLEQPPWSGSFLRLPYNVDVSSKTSKDVSLVEYIGRKRPVSYYGTQMGESGSWKVEIDRKDRETLYALRRLAIWPGDVYVREPSGTGYWANVTVTYNENHGTVTIPVSIEVTRVEGGV